MQCHQRAIDQARRGKDHRQEEMADTCFITPVPTMM